MPSDQAYIKHTALQYLEIDELLHVGLIEPILHGTAEILYAAPDGVFLKEKRSGAFMLSMQNDLVGKTLLEKQKGISLLCLCQKGFVDIAAHVFNYVNVLECYQSVYPGKKLIKCSSNLEIRLPTYAELKTIKQYYEKISEEELDMLFQLGNLYVGIYEQKFIGFIGRHLEGSIGLLNVFPEYRGNGFGKTLEIYLINKLLEQGCRPYCQVESANHESLSLQNKLGFEISKGTLFWMF